MNDVDHAAIDSALRLRRMMNEYIRKMTPQERDRILQRHLAQARGPVASALLLRKTTNAMLRANAANRKVSEENG